MYLWGKGDNFASLDLYDYGSYASFVVESRVEPGTPIVIPLTRRDIGDLIRLLKACQDDEADV